MKARTGSVVSTEVDVKSTGTRGGVSIHLIGLSEYDQDRVRSFAATIDAIAICHQAPDEFFLSRRIADGCAIAAFRFPRLTGFEFQQRLLGCHPLLPIIFVDRKPAIPDVVRAIRTGASNFLSEPWSQEEMRLAVTEALAEGRERRARAVRHGDSSRRFANLAQADAEVLELLIQGHANKVVAARLGIGLRTVERRRASALRTLGLNSLIEAVALRSELEESLRPTNETDQPFDHYDDVFSDRSNRAMIRPATSKK